MTDRESLCRQEMEETELAALRGEIMHQESIERHARSLTACILSGLIDALMERVFSDLRHEVSDTS